ncbi:MAG: SDR family NAD(P)-dependent oxidoreductase [Solirubrobacteraceae bacterium]
MSIPSPESGSVALVTGASSGIGRELARLLAARGHDLVLTARRRDRLEALAEELRSSHARRVEVISCDLSELEHRDALGGELVALGLTVDVLALSAGFGTGGEFVTQDAERVRLMVRTNFEGVVSLAGMFAPGMVKRGRGAILIVSSVAGNQPIARFGVYAATKAAVTSFAETLHEELRSSGVSVTVLCPGAVATEFADIAAMGATTTRLPGVLMATAEDTARAGLEALDRGRRHVVPGRATQLLHFAGGHVPRGLWLRACGKLMV